MKMQQPKIPAIVEGWLKLVALVVAISSASIAFDFMITGCGTILLYAAMHLYLKRTGTMDFIQREITRHRRETFQFNLEKKRLKSRKHGRD
jgi:hypothetical protein